MFDDDNIVSHAGLVPLLALAEQTNLSDLLDEHVRFACERVKSGAANATPKLTSIIAGMAAGADSIDDLDVIRSGGMKQLFRDVYAAPTLGILLREFTHGHTRQLSAVLRRHLITLATQTSVLDGITDRCFIDIDSLLRPVYGTRQTGRLVRPHEDLRQDRAPAWPVTPGRHHLHPCRSPDADRSPAPGRARR